MKKIVILLTMMALISVQVFAQTTITGKVTSKDDGGGIPGVAVRAKGIANVGAITDMDGKYSITVPAGEQAEMLVFSFVGLKTQEVRIGGAKELNVTMVSEDVALDDVVVTALGITREKKSLGYSVQEVSGDEIVKARESNVVNSLQGRVAGVQITNSSGQVGSSSRIVIRGIKSLTGENQPLFVVDGVPISNAYSDLGATGGIDYGNAASDINPADVEAITVLKGPSATALYGSRAANGVILITTKKGKGTKGLGVTFESNAMWSKPLILPDFQNKYGQGYDGEFEYLDGNWGGINDGIDESWGPALDGRPLTQFDSPYDPITDTRTPTPWIAHPDNVKSFFETGLVFTNSLSLTGSNERSNVRFSMTNQDEKGTLPNTDLKKNTISLAAGTSLSDKLSVEFTAQYIQNKSDNMPGNGYNSYNPLQQTSWAARQADWSVLKDKWNTYDPKQMLDGTTRGFNWNHSYHDNPYWVMYKNTNSRERNRLIGSFDVKYEFTDYLRLKLHAGNDFYSESRMERRAMYSKDWPKGGFYSWTRTFNELNAEALLTFNKEFGDFSVAANLGTAIRKLNYRDQESTVDELIVPDLYAVTNAAVPATTGLFFGKSEIQSVYGTATFAYKGYLSLDVTARNDWSSTLPANNNSYFYPSVSTSFVFSEALGIENNIFSFGKIRAGWAQVGASAPMYSLQGVYSAADLFDGNASLTYTNTIAPSGLKPESTTSYEIGTDLRFFQNRVSVDFSYYQSLTTEQILSIPVSRSTGFSAKTINAGEIQNTGIELMVNIVPIKKGDFSWDITLNYGRNRNEVLKLTEDMQFFNVYAGSWSMFVQARPGQPYGQMYGRGIVREERHENENGAVWYTGRPLINPATGKLIRTPENVILGNVMPDWNGSIRNTVTFKDLSLSFLIDAKIGGDMYSVTSWFGRYAGGLAETAVNNDNGKNIRDDIEDGGGMLAMSEFDETGVFGKIVSGKIEYLDKDGNPSTTAVVNDSKYIRPQDYFEDYWGKTEMGIFDGSFVKLREVTLSYSLRNIAFLSKLNITRVEVALVGRNLAILHSNIPHIDPENGFSAGNVQGVESNTLPSSRSYGFNLRLTF